jgi:excisionase family DNA binding protein
MSESARWLSTSQAAARLGVSEKTVRRRIERGELDAEKVPLDGGGVQWRIRLDSGTDIEMDSEMDSVPEVETEPRRNRAGTFEAVPEVVPEAQRTKSERAGTETNSEVDSAPEVSVPRVGTVSEVVPEVAALRDALERERELNSFLRDQIAEGNRNSQELRAALREALRAMPKALPIGEPTANSLHDQNLTKPHVSTPEAAATQTTPKRPTGPQNAPERAETARRGDGLSLVREGIRRIFGR